MEPRKIANLLRLATVSATLPNVDDSSEEADERYWELLRQAGPMQKLRIVGQLTRASRQMAGAGIKRQYPDASPEQIQAHLTERLYEIEVRKRLFPDVAEAPRR
jgi:hypothetical protein